MRLPVLATSPPAAVSTRHLPLARTCQEPLFADISTRENFSAILGPCQCLSLGSRGVKSTGEMGERAVSSIFGMRVHNGSPPTPRQRPRRQQERQNSPSEPARRGGDPGFPEAGPAGDPPPRDGTSPPVPANSPPSLDEGNESCRSLTKSPRGSAAKLT